MLDAVSINEIDIAVSPLTITSERENVLDFTHSYFTTGLSIAVSNKEDNNILTTAKNIFSTEFIEVVLLLSLTLFVVGFIVWLFERKRIKNNLVMELPKVWAQVFGGPLLQLQQSGMAINHLKQPAGEL